MAREGRNREAGPYTALLSPPPRPRFALLPRPRYPRKGLPRSRPRSCSSPVSSHAPDRGDIARGGAGEGTPSPSTKTIPALPQGSRAGAGALVVMAREGRNREAGPYTALLSPPPPGGDNAGDIPGKACPGAGPDPVLLRRHPMHRTVGISPGEGPGREPPPRRQKPYRPFPRAPAQVMAREGRPRGSDPKHYFPQASTHAPLSSLPHPCGRGQCR